MAKIPGTIVFTALTAFFGGGLAGAIFTWYINRPVATVMTYTIGTTTLGTSQVSSVVPNLKIQIGDQGVTSLSTHTIEMTTASGPFLEKTEFAITFPSEVRIFGKHLDAPTSLQSIECTQVPTGLRCIMGPLSSKIARPYRIILATNSPDPPGIEIAAKNVEAVSGTEYIKQTNEPFWTRLKHDEQLRIAWSVAISAVLAYFVVSFTTFRRLRKTTYRDKA